MSLIKDRTNQVFDLDKALNNLKFSKVRYCFEMICFVVFFVGMGYIGVSKFVVDFIK